MGARHNPAGAYGIRILGTPSRISPDDFYAETVNIDCQADSREAAIQRYNEVRAATFQQQVTLYGPRGNRIREARGTAMVPGEVATAMVMMDITTKSADQYRAEIWGLRASIDDEIMHLGNREMGDAGAILEQIHGLAQRLETTRAEFAKKWPGHYAAYPSKDSR